MDDARQIDATAGMSAPENEAKCLKGQKSPRNGGKNGVMAEDFTQKPLLQTIRLCTAAAGELFRTSLKLKLESVNKILLFCLCPQLQQVVSTRTSSSGESTCLCI